MPDAGSRLPARANSCTVRLNRLARVCQAPPVVAEVARLPVRRDSALLKAVRMPVRAVVAHGAGRVGTQMPDKETCANFRAPRTAQIIQTGTRVPGSLAKNQRAEMVASSR